MDKDHIWQLIIGELTNEPYQPIIVGKKQYPQNLLTTLKRVNKKALTDLNKHIKLLQTKEKVKLGYAYTKKRSATVPLWLDYTFLLELDKVFANYEKWETECDDDGLPIKKKLVNRHPYRAELQKLKSFAILKHQTDNLAPLT